MIEFPAQKYSPHARMNVMSAARVEVDVFALIIASPRLASATMQETRHEDQTLPHLDFDNHFCSPVESTCDR